MTSRESRFRTTEIFFAAGLVLFPSEVGGSETRHDLSGATLPQSQAPAVGFSSKPELVSDGGIDLPLDLLIKKECRGTVSIEIDLDRRGTVERCVVRRGVEPLLDSCVAESMRDALFTPAYDQGKAVPSTVTFSFKFDPETVVRNSAGAQPAIQGTVLEKTTGNPIRDATVHLEAVNPENDADLKIPLDPYLRLIGEVPGQSYSYGTLIAMSDSLGRFAFRLLPACPVHLAVTARGFEMSHGSFDVRPDVAGKITFHLEELYKDSSIDIVVFGTPERPERIDIEEVQIASGLTHYLSGVLQTRAAVRSVPESRSNMTVRAGSPFENRYYICGVPFLSPYHFGGHSYADFDGLMISALSEVDLDLDRIAGRQIDGSGFRLEAQPGIYRPANKRLLKRPELSVDLNTAGQDLLFSLPRPKSEDCLQLGFTRSEDYSLLFFDSRRNFEWNEYGDPASYGNVTLTGSAALKSWDADAFGWFAWDTYDMGSDRKKTFPWGMAALVLTPEGRLPKVRAGGSHQYFASGKWHGTSLYRHYTGLSNGVLSFSCDSLVRGGFVTMGLELQTEYSRWDGSVDRYLEEVDSLPRLYGGSDYFPYDTARIAVSRAEGREHSLQAIGTVSGTLGPFTLTTDFLCAGFLYGKKPDAAVDAGVSLIWKGTHMRAALHGGRVTSRPDIRGLPDGRLRRERSSACLCSAPVSVRFGSRGRVGVQPYIRTKENEPRLDPVLRTWMPGSATRIFAKGIDTDAEIRVFDWLTLNGVANFSRARRLSPDGEEIAPYEWDIPAGGKGGVHLQFGDEATMHIYLNFVIAGGLPVDDIHEAEISRMPEYRRVDLSFQFRHRDIVHRFLTRYDAYVNIYNMTDRYNATDYFLDEAFRLRFIPLSQMSFEAGVRLGFRI